MLWPHTKTLAVFDKHRKIKKSQIVSHLYLPGISFTICHCLLPSRHGSAKPRQTQITFH